jgi:uncharacterized protein (DUF1810 family)
MLPPAKWHSCSYSEEVEDVTMRKTGWADSFDLRRFVDAQDSVYEQVRRELRSGEKRSHWMWFIFPQIAGLGQSSTARKYAISSLAEAQAYLQHPVLGARLQECTRLVNDTKGRSIDDIFGYPDNLKFRSCMTLFAQASEHNEVFNEALTKYFDGEPDPSTLQLLK